MIFLLFIIFSLSFIFLILSKNRKKESLHPPPGPKRLPIIGNLHQYDFSTPHVYLANLGKAYGPIVSLRLGSVNVVAVLSAELAKEVLKTQDLNFCSRPPMTGMQKLSYNGLDISFSQYNEYFREMKKIGVVHVLSSIRVKSFAPIQQEEISRMISEISSVSGVVNLGNFVTDFACRLICKIAFGRSYEDDEGSMYKFRTLLDEAEKMFIDFAFSDYFPRLGWAVDKLVGKSATLDKVYRDLDAFYEKIIEDHLRTFNHESDNKNREDIVDVLLHLRKERSYTFDFTLDHVKAILMDMFIAGTDTSSATIVLAMTELIKNPTTMIKVQDEIRSVIGNKGCVTEDDLRNLNYFQAVVKETFRLHPVLPLLIAHQAIRKTKLHEYDILPESIVFVNVWAIGRDPTYWNDPETFIPERFLESSIDFKGQDFTLLPFGAGRRMCPGVHLGSLNVELRLANLLYFFNWELPDGVEAVDVDTNTHPGLVTHKMNPLYLVATKFSQNQSVFLKFKAFVYSLCFSIKLRVL